MFLICMTNLPNKSIEIPVIPLSNQLKIHSLLKMTVAKFIFGIRSIKLAISVIQSSKFELWR